MKVGPRKSPLNPGANLKGGGSRTFPCDAYTPHTTPEEITDLLDPNH